MSDFGELLRQARAYKGVSLRDAERATRINRHYLAALEQEDFDELPPLIYARGIVRKYAEYLGLDPVAVLSLFENFHGQRSGGFRVVPAVKPLDVPSHWAPNFAVIAFMVVMSAVIFAWMYSAYFAPPDQVPGSGDSVAEISADDPTVTVNLSTPEVTITESVIQTPTTSPSPSPTANVAPTPTPTPDTHQFAVIASEDVDPDRGVWVQVTIDGEVVFDNTMFAGDTNTFTGKQMRVTSGNAARVQVTVDGVDQGVLGEVWNAERTYPGSSPE